MRTYTRIRTHNSENARRQRLWGMLPDKMGELKWRDCLSVTMVRGEGEPAGRMHSREVIRAMRSRYRPHIGKKHAAKLKLRAAVA